ncbi:MULTISPECIES: PTS sugar transporter subunit IIB [Lacticaseibacillus]|uniref:PTS sugar transporter subunit IIB n=1 Tax=Lacticaseibacillus TaxID=2759736 RepID=UPI000F0B3809|nr:MULTISPECIES: PTS sugar transporter subunit IIB [Lacticaseibacillus]MBB1165966.1 PTS sugar transporter subunit IIB [Lacticaseibacillus rhamnosus]NMN63984.1 PTS system cellobiose-specific IIB component [Lacticaseibacillus casei]RND50021.1 Lichenan-specific phosphotransferase enzyme IIB component [Lacticaseibacillus paracasei]RND61008.1 Lichenan-specific phosphotransferase enzyme IIB component [Lacticaseibacillus paracasei]
MTDKKIMLVCAAGMSTSMLVARMQKAAEKDGIEVNIFATAASDAGNKLADEKPDVLMLGPQVRYLEGQFKKDFDIPVHVINMQDYGLMNGEKVLKASLKAIADGKQGEEA